MTTCRSRGSGAGIVLVLALAGCARPRYVVTARPIDLGLGPDGFCVAIDTRDPRGVWWWQPGLASTSDCSHRSTGPSVFHADRAVVAASGQPGVTDVRFRMGLITRPGSQAPPFRDIHLRLDATHLRSTATGSDVPTTRRRDLRVPADAG